MGQGEMQPEDKSHTSHISQWRVTWLYGSPRYCIERKQKSNWKQNHIYELKCRSILTRETHKGYTMCPKHCHACLIGKSADINTVDRGTRIDNRAEHQNMAVTMPWRPTLKSEAREAGTIPYCALGRCNLDLFSPHVYMAHHFTDLSSSKCCCL